MRKYIEWIDENKRRRDGNAVAGADGDGERREGTDRRASRSLKKVGLAGAGERSVPHATVWIDESLAFNHARDW